MLRVDVVKYQYQSQRHDGTEVWFSTLPSVYSHLGLGIGIAFAPRVVAVCVGEVGAVESHILCVQVVDRQPLGGIF